MQKRLVAFAGVSGAIAVALGAMCAHFLRSQLDAGLITQNDFHAFETGATYQMYHSIALLGVALLFDKLHTKRVQKAAYCFMIGIVLFSGSLYLLSTSSLIGLTSIRWLGPITPIGGLFFIAGWLLLAFSALKKRE